MCNHNDTQKKYCGQCYDIYPIQSHSTKMAACGRHHYKRGGAAFSRATSFVVSFVCALHGAGILALSTIYDLRLSKTGRTVVGRTFDWMDGRSDAVSLLSGSFFKGMILPKKQMASPHMAFRHETTAFRHEHHAVGHQSHALRYKTNAFGRQHQVCRSQSTAFGHQSTEHIVVYGRSPHGFP